MVFLTATVAGAALGYLIMSLTLTMLPYEPSNAFLAVFLGANFALPRPACGERAGVRGPFLAVQPGAVT